MTQTQLIGIIAMSVIFLFTYDTGILSNNYSLNGIKRKTVGQGQHGVARFATKSGGETHIYPSTF